MKYFTIVCMLFLISCESTSSRTDKFADLRNVDFAQGKPYSVAADRNNSVYFVEYDTLSYIVRMPIDSDSIISVYQKKNIRSEQEADSLRNNGVDLLIKIPLDSNVTTSLEDICKRYRFIIQLYHRYMILSKIQVDSKNNVLVRLLWKNNDVIYNVYLSPSNDLFYLRNFPFDDFVSEGFYVDDYVQIDEGVYCRDVDMMEYNIAKRSGLKY